MASKAAIAAVFAKLIRAQVANAPAPHDFEALVDDWADLMPDITDADLAAALAAYRRDPKVCQFWPQPGTLIGLVPSRQAAAIDDAEVVFGQAMRYMIDHPPRWVPKGENGPRYYTPDAAPDLEPMRYPPPPWPEDRTDAINRATAAMGGLTKYSHAETGGYASQQAEKTWKAAYRAIRKGDALALEGAKVARLTGPDRRAITAEAK